VIAESVSDLWQGVRTTWPDSRRAVSWMDSRVTVMRP
jgi:hypothetical protein